MVMAGPIFAACVETSSAFPAFHHARPGKLYPLVCSTQRSTAHGDEADLPSLLRIAERSDEGDVLPIRRPHGHGVVSRTIGQSKRHRVRPERLDRNARAGRVLGYP